MRNLGSSVLIRQRPCAYGLSVALLYQYERGKSSIKRAISRNFGEFWSRLGPYPNRLFLFFGESKRAGRLDQLFCRIGVGASIAFIQFNNFTAKPETRGAQIFGDIESIGCGEARSFFWIGVQKIIALGGAIGGDLDRRGTNVSGSAKLYYFRRYYNSYPHIMSSGY